MDELISKQIIFTRYLTKLLEAFPELNIVYGEAWRSPETCQAYVHEGKGIEHSCHTIRLAVDLLIHKDDGSLDNQKSSYEPLGNYWKSLPTISPTDIKVVTCWGGDFTNLCDFYHLSIEHNGVK